MPTVRAFFDRVQQGDPLRTKIAIVATSHFLARAIWSTMLKHGTAAGLVELKGLFEHVARESVEKVDLLISNPGFFTRKADLFTKVPL